MMLTLYESFLTSFLFFFRHEVAQQSKETSCSVLSPLSNRANNSCGVHRLLIRLPGTSLLKPNNICPHFPNGFSISFNFPQLDNIFPIKFVGLSFIPSLLKRRCIIIWKLPLGQSLFLSNQESAVD